LGILFGLSLPPLASRSLRYAHLRIWETNKAHIVQVVTGTVNTTFFENQAKYLDVPQSIEYFHGDLIKKADTVV
jgi:hypothetical protein